MAEIAKAPKCISPIRLTKIMVALIINIPAISLNLKAKEEIKIINHPKNTPNNPTILEKVSMVKLIEFTTFSPSVILVINPVAVYVPVALSNISPTLHTKVADNCVEFLLHIAIIDSEEILFCCTNNLPKVKLLEVSRYVKVILLVLLLKNKFLIS